MRLGQDAGPVTADGLRAWRRDNMAPYKVPLVEIVDELRLTATDKIRKHLLAERAEVVR